MSPPLLGMWNDREENVRVAINLKVKPIVIIHSCLPDVICLIVFLGPQRCCWTEEKLMLIELGLVFVLKLLTLPKKAARE